MSNPLFLQNSIFSNKFKKSIGSKYNEFADDFFCNWVYHIYLSEQETTIAYPEILDNIKKGTYQKFLANIGSKENLAIHQYFEKMIEDENDHAIIFNQLLHNNFNIIVTENEIQKLIDNVDYKFATSDLIKLLIDYYIGECYAWTGFYFIYKQTTDPDVKKLFHRLVVDETHHNNNIYKFLKIIKNNANFNNEFFVSNTKRLRFFGLQFVKDRLNLPDTNTKKDQWWNNLIYNYQWHWDFNRIFLKKCYQLYQLFNPEVTFEDFFNLINKNELDWLSCKN